LYACYQAFCAELGLGKRRIQKDVPFLSKEKTYDASGWINIPREGIDRNNMAGGFVPRTIFAPVRGGNFLPRVIESAIERIDTHDKSKGEGKVWVVWSVECDCKLGLLVQCAIRTFSVARFSTEY
jgi:hypothetical protein